jgi:mannose/fructose/N-acetylgalactosamine-specific phosphotransferase system component IIC
MPFNPETLLQIAGFMLVCILLLTLVNLGILGLGLKLYTEILKDKSQNRRMGKEG